MGDVAVAAAPEPEPCSLSIEQLRGDVKDAQIRRDALLKWQADHEGEPVPENVQLLPIELDLLAGLCQCRAKICRHRTSILGCVVQFFRRTGARTEGWWYEKLSIAIACIFYVISLSIFKTSLPGTALCIAIALGFTRFACTWCQQRERTGEVVATSEESLLRAGSAAPAAHVIGR
eukprot:GDKH01000975.1.p1 GENE.GDKH01000975.1~~GDKH01000975.1.p1  ORF type:complete len:176 (-),score=9.69 GDKH01000975.1:217-744(-)